MIRSTPQPGDWRLLRTLTAPATLGSILVLVNSDATAGVVARVRLAIVPDATSLSAKWEVLSDIAVEQGNLLQWEFVPALPLDVGHSIHAYTDAAHTNFWLFGAGL